MEGGKNGLSRVDRERRITSAESFSVINNDRKVLLNQVLRFARFITYFDHANIPDGHFDELLDELKKVSEQEEMPEPDGDMEPSQALLYTFLELLREVTQQFNDRWGAYAEWYLREVLGVSALPATPGNAWFSFEKEGSDSVCLQQGTPFHLKLNDRTIDTYRLSEDLEVQDIQLARVCSLHFEKDKYMLPATYLNAITSVKIKDLLNSEPDDEQMFGRNRPAGYAKALGLVISAPSLLLREGKREVAVTFRSENQAWADSLELIARTLRNYFYEWSSEKILYKLFYEAFYVAVSIPGGWREITGYTVGREGKDLMLKFILSEEFPETHRCEEETHQMTTDFPVLRVYPNFDAWFYPYFWLKDFLLSKICIETSVENISNVQLYNELGRVDNSKPFNPFGLNTELGAWFVLGNYEMSLKSIQSVDLQIKWQQLPAGEKGLSDHYREYKEGIDNRSFRLSAKYLTDYNWYDTSGKELFYLFSTINKDGSGAPLAEGELSQESKLANIRLERMPPLLCAEEEYDYSIRSRTGFVRFTLEEPSMGLGENCYRRLFTDQLLRSTLRKKKQEALNMPFNPVVERFSLSYRSKDVIDLRKQKPAGTEIYQSYPLGYVSVYTHAQSHDLPFVYRLSTDANILFALERVKGGEVLTLFLDFMPVNKEFTCQHLPRITWFWGNGYDWYEMPPDAILSDSTQSFIVSGMIKIRIPDTIDTSSLDAGGWLWLRAGIRDYEENVPGLFSVHTNAVRLEQDITDDERPDDVVDEEKVYEMVPAGKLPGIRRFHQISPVFGGREKENSLDKQIRVSEYVTHRGKAVTARDYERIVLQAFPDVAKVKCLPGYDCTSCRKGVVSIVVIPVTEECGAAVGKPLATAHLMLQIESYLTGVTSPCVRHIDVINPEYEELLIRCDVAFHENYSQALCKMELSQLFNRRIAPWQENKELPEFNYPVNLDELHDSVASLKFVKAVNHLSAIRFAGNSGCHRIYEYGEGACAICPEQPHVIFVPARKHIIETGILAEFGISEMTVSENFIIGS